MRNVLVVLGVVAYLAVGGFPYLFSGLLAPPAGVAFLMVGWALGLVATLLLARRRSLWVLAAAPLAIAFWCATLTAGEYLFGWTA